MKPGITLESLFKNFNNMLIHELAKSYHFTKEKRDEKQRVIKYDHPRKLQDLQRNAYDVDSKLRVTAYRNDIRNDEIILTQYETELREIRDELKPLLAEVNAKADDKLEVHLQGNIYLSAYLNDEGDIITSVYDKVN